MRKWMLAAAVVMVTAGCSLKFEGRLLQPLNRETGGTGEAALVAQAVALLAKGQTVDAVIQNIVDTGHSQEQARRIVALAVMKGGR